MSAVVAADGEKFDTQVPLIIIGAGAAGLCAALAAKEAGLDAVVIERDDVPSGSTALSAGLIPAAGTRFQRDKSIADSPVMFAADIQRKAQGEADRAVVMWWRRVRVHWSNGSRTVMACPSRWSITSTIPVIRPCACTAYLAAPGAS